MGIYLNPGNEPFVVSVNSEFYVDMLGGLRCPVDVESFQNDIASFHSADDYKTKEVFIPNMEDPASVESNRLPVHTMQ